MAMLKIVEVNDSERTKLDSSIISKERFIPLEGPFEVVHLVNTNFFNTDQTTDKETPTCTVECNGGIYNIYKDQSAYIVNNEGKTLQVIHKGS